MTFSTSQDEFAPPSSVLQRAMPYILLTMAVLIAYANIYGNGFVFDDDLIIVRNDLLQSWSNVSKIFTASTTEGAHIAGGFYRPVQVFLYLITYQFGGGLEPFGFHILNVAIHVANVCLMYALGRKLKFNATAVFCATLVWAVHPLHIEAVTYMSGTADVLFGFFSLLCCLLLMPDCSPWRVGLTVPVYLLGLLSKETCVIIPALVVLCLFTTNDRRMDWRLYVRTWPFWGMAVIYTVLRVGSDQFDGPRRYELLYNLPDFAYLASYAAHFSYRFYTFLATLPNYVLLLIWPVDLHMERSFPIYQEPWASVIIIGAIMAAAALGCLVWALMQCKLVPRSHLLPLGWGIAWAATTHAPDSGLLMPVNALFLEHWMYLPSIGLFLSITQGLAEMAETHHGLVRLRGAGIGLAIISAGVLTILTLKQNATWRDPITFYTNMFKYDVVSARAHNNLALAYLDHNDATHALEEFQKAMAITDTYAETRHNYAVTLMNLPDAERHVPEAIYNLNRALEIDPNFYRSLDALSQIYAHTDDTQKAAYYARRAELAKAQINNTGK